MNSRGGVTLFIFFLSILLWQNGVASEQTDLPPAVELPKDWVDMGAVKRGSLSEGSFIIKNKGGAELAIQSMKPDCDCITVTPETMTIAPGQMVEVKVVLDSEGKTGEFIRHINIKSNDPSYPHSYVQVSANVQNAGHIGKDIANKPIFEGECASCHIALTEGKLGQELFESACYMCHGHYGLGGTAPILNDLKYLSKHDDAHIRKIISEGKPGTTMSAFAKSKGEILSQAQIDSLVELVRWWQQGYVYERYDIRVDAK